MSETSGSQDGALPGRGWTNPDDDQHVQADVAVLIRAYTRDGDLVVDLDAHPITAAASFLHRIPATLTGTGDDEHLRRLPVPSDQPGPTPTADGLDDGAGLVLVTLPRPGVNLGDRTALAAALWRWRCLLRPRGHLIVVLAGTGRPGALGQRSTVVAAADQAWLHWQQHLLIVAAPPNPDPRVEPAAVPIGARLLDGRHVPAHRTVLVFSTAARAEAFHG